MNVVSPENYAGSGSLRFSKGWQLSCKRKLTCEGLLPAVPRTAPSVHRLQCGAMNAVLRMLALKFKEGPLGAISQGEFQRQNHLEPINNKRLAER